MHWKKQVYRKFELPERERSGLLLLIFICIIAIALPELFALYHLRINARILSEFVLPADSIQDLQPPSSVVEPSLAVQQRADSMFFFDPNTIDSAGWISLGVSAGVCGTILKYLRAGGRFRQREDLAGIYTMPAKEYKRLEPWIHIPPVQYSHPRNSFPDKPAGEGAHKAPSIANDFKLDINLATAEEFAQLPGFNLYLGRRAIRFRSALGGFYSADQMADLYGLPDSVYLMARPHLFRGSTKIELLDINTVGIDELSAHPYVPPWIAERMIKYRSAKGGFMHLSEIKKVYGITDSLYHKITPYLEVIDPSTVE